MQEFNTSPSQLLLIWPAAINSYIIVFLLLQLLSLIMLLVSMQSRHVLNFYSDKFNNFLSDNTFDAFFVLILNVVLTFSIGSSFWLNLVQQANLDL